MLTCRNRWWWLLHNAEKEILNTLGVKFEVKQDQQNQCTMMKLENKIK